ncbi:MAG: class I SAM-dependent methyltransferase [Actinomycetota bacterium]
MSRWNERTDVQRGDDYDEKWALLAAEGASVHGEADALCRLLASGSVLDAGCGTGRVGIEMAARGYAVVGVDLDPEMLATARAKAPDIEWHLGDLATIDLGRRFDLIALPGNVMIFVAPGSEAAVMANLERHLAVGGLLIAGFQLAEGRLTLADYDAHAAAVGLERADRWSTWDGDRFEAKGAEYAVSLHRRATVAE